jgi:hypothetical protein
MRLCYPHWRLESLLFDDLIQEMMRADNVDPDEIRTLFNKLATVKHSGVAARQIAWRARTHPIHNL